MGSGKFNSSASTMAYANYAASTVGKSTDEVYTKRALDPYLDPMNVKLRESRDSADNPESTPLIVALDVTGSMGMLADNIAREGLGILFNGIYDKKPISDPHIMFMGIGDVAAGDSAPLQVSQFEADARIIEQLAKLYLEHGGGGNNYESYHLPWYFAAFHTVHDSMEKRGKRGYLFTVGDEEVPLPLTPTQIKLVTGDITEAKLSTRDMLELAQRTYDCYHIIVKEGSHCRARFPEVHASWIELMGQHVIVLADHKALAQTITSAIEVAEGRSAEDAAKGWGSLAGPVFDAVKHLPKGRGPGLLAAPK